MNIKRAVFSLLVFGLISTASLDVIANSAASIHAAKSYPTDPDQGGWIDTQFRFEFTSGTGHVTQISIDLTQNSLGPSEFDYADSNYSIFIKSLSGMNENDVSFSFSEYIDGATAKKLNLRFVDGAFAPGDGLIFDVSTRTRYENGPGIEVSAALSDGRSGRAKLEGSDQLAEAMVFLNGPSSGPVFYVNNYQANSSDWRAAAAALGAVVNSNINFETHPVGVFDGDHYRRSDGVSITGTDIGPVRFGTVEQGNETSSVGGEGRHADSNYLFMGGVLGPSSSQLTVNFHHGPVVGAGLFTHDYFNFAQTMRLEAFSGVNATGTLLGTAYSGSAPRTIATTPSFGYASEPFQIALLTGRQVASRSRILEDPWVVTHRNM